jgi:hypothetical protein
MPATHTDLPIVQAAVAGVACLVLMWNGGRATCAVLHALPNANRGNRR